MLENKRGAIVDMLIVTTTTVISLTFAMVVLTLGFASSAYAKQEAKLKNQINLFKGKSKNTPMTVIKKWQTRLGDSDKDVYFLEADIHGRRFVFFNTYNSSNVKCLEFGRMRLPRLIVKNHIPFNKKKIIAFLTKTFKTTIGEKRLNEIKTIYARFNTTKSTKKAEADPAAKDKETPGGGK